MKKLSLIIFFCFAFIFSAIAGTDGENKLSKKDGLPVKDCFEGVNRGVFAFNQVLDNVIFEPLAKGYRYLPSPIKTGASNAVVNISNLITIPNNILQGDIKKAGSNSMRFVINTTVGILGLFDPATKLGFEKKEKEDYGQTLGSWGVGEGCYLVLPIIGPSTARDTLGFICITVGW